MIAEGSESEILKHTRMKFAWSMFGKYTVYNGVTKSHSDRNVSWLMLFLNLDSLKLVTNLAMRLDFWDRPVTY